MIRPAIIISIHLEERHPVDEALGCMVPVVIGISILASSIVFILRMIL